MAGTLRLLRNHPGDHPTPKRGADTKGKKEVNPSLTKRVTFSIAGDKPCECHSEIHQNLTGIVFVGLSCPFEIEFVFVTVNQAMISQLNS